MAKRFTDTAKWDKAWFRRLPPKLKCAWLYLCDKCDEAGVWDIDLDAMEFFVGQMVTLEELVHHFAVEIINDDKLYLPKFIEFQYGELSTECKPHIKVIKTLKKHNLYKGYPKGMETLEDKDKEEEEDQEKEKGGVGGKTEFQQPKFDFDAIYKNYPRKIGKKIGLKTCKRVIKTPDEYAKLSAAVNRYRDDCLKNKTETQFIQHFSTFMNCWEDWCDPETGSGLTNPQNQNDEFLRLIRERGIYDDTTGVSNTNE